MTTKIAPFPFRSSRAAQSLGSSHSKIVWKRVSLVIFVQIVLFTMTSTVELDMVTNTTAMTTKPTRPFLRFVFGIFTMDSPMEQERRTAIRNTYLSFYKHWNETKTLHQICSLQELLQSPHRQRSTTDCQFVYTFLLGGGNPETHPPELFWKDDVNSAGEMIMKEDSERINFSDPSEYRTNQDMLFLNIKENRDEGKIPTWFQYGAALLEEQPELNIDYFGKIDSDTLVYPKNFFDWVNANETQNFLRQPRVYGGYLHTRERCLTWGEFCDEDHMTAPLFMTGAMVLVSAPLSKYIGLELTRAEKQKEFVPGIAEDVVLANLIYHNATEDNPVHAIRLPQRPARHPLKKPSRMVKFYREHMIWQEYLRQKDNNNNSTNGELDFEEFKKNFTTTYYHNLAIK